MSDSASATTPKKAKKVAAKPKKAATHPKYIDMVMTAIKTLGERGGSSRQAISKYITEHYKVGDSVKSQLKMCLKRGVASGALINSKGTGASGSFKVAGDKKPASTVKKTTKTAVAAKKKPAASKAKKAKTPTKKKAASAKAKKTPTKAKKPAAKKAAKPKKSPKKAPKAKKPTKK